MSSSSTERQPARPRRAAGSLLVLLTGTTALTIMLAACSGGGALGPVATPVASTEASERGASPEATPPPDRTSPPTAAPDGSPDATAGPTPGLSATPDETPVSTAAPTVRPGATPSATPVGTTTVRAYFLMRNRDGGDPLLVPVLRSVPATRAVATAAVRELLGGPAANEEGIATTIPSGTTLLRITISGSTATVDLSGTFGTGGGTFSMLGRLAQLVYTVTQFDNVETVMLRLDGEPVSVLGGEGIEIGGGMRRTDFRDYLPAIFVDRPAWRGALPSDGHVAGLASVFEAQFVLRLFASDGSQLFETPVLASQGAPGWGSFDVIASYGVSTAQWGTLRVFYPSAKDGTPTSVRDYRVWLTP